MTLAFFGWIAGEARAAAPWWHLSEEIVPTNLKPEEGGGKPQQIHILVSNLGDAPAQGNETPVTITDKLPSGLTASSVDTYVLNGVPVKCSIASAVTCTFAGVVNPYEELVIPVNVKVNEPKGTATTLSQTATVAGGGASGEITASLPVSISEQAAAFGLSAYELGLYSESGLPATLAGSHPFQLTTTLVLNQTDDEQPVALPRDLSFRLPLGLIGNPTAVSRCTMADFVATVEQTNLCPAGSVVGVATVTANEPKYVHVFTRTVPVFNLVPAQGEPARLGFEVLGKVPIVIDTSVSPGNDYSVVATVKDATQTAGLLSSQVTLWGEPGASQHDNARGWECVAGGTYAIEAKKSCPAPGELELANVPFLSSPTSCSVNSSAEPVVSAAEADSWTEPDNVLDTEYSWMNENSRPFGFEGCRELPFAPELKVSPEESMAASPSGVEVRVHVPTEGLVTAGGRSEADVRDTTVALPEGVKLNSAAANGLQACPEVSEAGFEGVGFTGFAKFLGSGLEAGEETATFTPTFRFVEEEVEGRRLAPSCPDGSKVGTVKIKTPLLSHELEGGVYLADPAPNGEAGRNPFDSLVALYIVAEDPESGVLVKLAGEGDVDEGTLQISTTFTNTPQVPFEELTLNLFGGPRASVSTPEHCGSYTTSGEFTPWSGIPAANIDAEPFAVSTGAGGVGCPGGTLPFSPGFTAYSQSTQAGAFSPFTLELSRPDGDQALSSVGMHLPSGIAALLSSVELCSAAQAAANACPAGSEVGRAIAYAGLGPEPFVQAGGKVYITGPYGGAPFGLDIVTPADAGPFDLGYISVRSRLYVNESDASVTIDSEPLPTEIRGIPLQLKRVVVQVDRPDFEFNPTNCAQKTIGGTITGAEGASVGVEAPFKVEECGALPFSPTLTASAVGHGSKADGTTFKVIVTSGGVGPDGVAQSGIAKVDLQLPKQLSSRLPTLQKACTEAVFDANPASCPEVSVIGYATIHTPVLANPLSGPAYLVSHGASAFPDVEFVLQGEGIKLVLDGKTQIKGQVTYSKFETTPDAPFTTFETLLPAGPHGVLTPNVAESKHFSLCGENLQMPTTIIAQNGATIEHNTKITIEGCGAVKASRAKKLTRTQLLAKALNACVRKYKHRKHKRLQCEKRARQKYAAKKVSTQKHERHAAGSKKDK